VQQSIIFSYLTILQFLSRRRCDLKSEDISQQKKLWPWWLWRTGLYIFGEREKSPESVEFYNSKYGVHVLNQTAQKYSVQASCRRWPLRVFYNNA